MKTLARTLDQSSKNRNASIALGLNHRIIICGSCDSPYHIKCGGVTPKQHKTMTKSDQTWNCLHCAQLTATSSNDALTALPFSHTTDESFSLLFGGNQQESIGNLTADLASNADDLYNNVAN